MFQRLTVLILIFTFNFAFAQSKPKGWYNLNAQQKNALDPINKQIGELNRQNEAYKRNMDDLVGQKKCKDVTEASVSECTKKLADINGQLNSIAKSADQVQVEIFRKQKEFDESVERFRKENADAAKAEASKKAMDQAAGKVSARESQDLEVMNYETSNEFLRAGLSAQSLMIDIANSKTTLAKFESNLDKSRMGLYLQIKMRELLTDATMCDVVKQCGKNSKATLGSEALKNVFSSINEEGKPYAPYSNEGRGRNAPPAPHTGTR